MNDLHNNWEAEVVSLRAEVATLRAVNVLLERAARAEGVVDGLREARTAEGEKLSGVMTLMAHALDTWAQTQTRSVSLDAVIEALHDVARTVKAPARAAKAPAHAPEADFREGPPVLDDYVLPPALRTTPQVYVTVGVGAEEVDMLMPGDLTWLDLFDAAAPYIAGDRTLQARVAVGSKPSHTYVKTLFCYATDPLYAAWKHAKGA